MVKRDLTVQKKKKNENFEHANGKTTFYNFFACHEILFPELGPLEVRFACHPSYCC